MPDPISESQSWSGAVSAKKITWGLGKYVAATAAAKVTGTALFLPALDALNAAGDTLKPYGITFHLDPVVLPQMLPALFFAILVAGHDYVKLKTDSKYL